MPNITEAHRRSYSSILKNSFQQTTSRLEGRITVEKGAKGEVHFYDRIGQTDGYIQTARHADVQFQDMEHEKIALYPERWLWGTLIDDDDKMKMMFDPSSNYLQQAKSAHERYVDEIIMKALYGSMRMGKNGASVKALPISGTESVLVGVADHTYNSAGTGNAALTVSKLLKAKAILAADEADAYDANDVNSAVLTLCCTQDDINNMLMEEKAVNSDYVQMVNSFIEGRVKVLLGFAFIRVKQSFFQTPATGQRRLPVFHKEAVLLAKWKDLQTSIKDLPSKDNVAAITASCSLGASRVKDGGVVMIDVKT